MYSKFSSLESTDAQDRSPPLIRRTRCKRRSLSRRSEHGPSTRPRVCSSKLYRKATPKHVTTRGHCRHGLVAGIDRLIQDCSKLLHILRYGDLYRPRPRQCTRWLRFCEVNHRYRKAFEEIAKCCNILRTARTFSAYVTVLSPYDAMYGSPSGPFVGKLIVKPEITSTHALHEPFCSKSVVNFPATVRDTSLRVRSALFLALAGSNTRTWVSLPTCLL